MYKPENEFIEILMRRYRIALMAVCLMGICVADASARKVAAADDNRPQPVVSFVKVEHTADWYATQERLWRAEADKTPTDDEAWLNLWHATRYRMQYTDGNADREALLALADEVSAKAPQSYADYMIDYWTKCVYGLRTGDVHMSEAIAMRPDYIASYPDYVAWLLRTDDEQSLTDILTRWYQSGEFSPTLLNYFYNVLVGLDERAVLFVNGDVPTYACLMLQHAKGLFTDCKVVCVGLLYSNAYRQGLCRQLGIAEIPAPTSYSQQDMMAWEENAYRQIISATGRPGYFSAVMELPSFQDKLYSEGLVYRYSEKRYDNLSVKRRNYEERYLTDYLWEHFSPETYSASAYMLNLNYIPCFKSLLDWYKSTGDKNHYRNLVRMMKRIVDRAENLTDDERQEYYAEIAR